MNLIGAFIFPLIPVLGKILLMIPLVPNTLVPFILTAINTVVKYMTLAGLMPEEAPVPSDPGALLSGDPVALAGFFGDLGRGGLALGWSLVETLASQALYKWRVRVAEKTGGTAWLAQGKKSIW